MLSSRLKRYKVSWIIRCFSIMLLISIICLSVLDIRLRPLLNDYAMSQAKSFALDTINVAVSQTLKDYSDCFDSVVNFKYDDSGKIIALSTNSSSVDMIASAVFIKAHDLLSSNNGHICDINVGTLSGSTLLYSRGPSLKIHIKFSRYINYELISGFTEAGINQTKNSLYLKLTTNIHSIIPGDSRTETISTKILIAETVIVGEVPEAFTEVIQVGSSEFDTADTLVNFGQ